jgi:hypothetical protein
MSKKRDREAEKEAIVTEMTLLKKKVLDTAKELNTEYNRHTDFGENASGEDIMASLMLLAPKLEIKRKELRNFKKKYNQLEKRHKKYLE